MPSRRTWLLSGLGGFLVLILAAFVVLSSLDVDEYRGVILERLSQTLGREARASKVDLSLIPLRLRLMDVQVPEAEEFGKGEFFKAEAILLDVSLLALLTGDVVIDRFELERPLLYMRQDSTGAWNLSRLARPSQAVGESAPAGGSSGSPSPVRNWTLSNGTLVIERFGREPTRLENIDARLTGINSTSSFPIRMATDVAGQGRVKVEGRVGPLDSDNLLRTPFQSEISFRNVAPQALGTLLPMPGRLDGLGRVSATLQLESTGSEYDLSGSVQLTSDGAGDPSAAPEGTLTFDIKAAPQPDGLSLNGNVRLADFAVSALMEMARSVSLDPLPGAELAGIIDGAIAISGVLGSESVKPSGKIRVTDGSLRRQGWSGPIELKTARLEFDEDSAALSEMSLKAAGSDMQGWLRLSGFDSPRVSFKISGKTLDLASLRTLLGQDVPAESSRATNSGPGWMQKAVGKGEVRFDRVLQGDFVMESLRATVSLDKGRISCNPIQFGLYEGKGKGRLNVDLRQEEPAVSFKGRFENVDLNKLVSANTESKDRLYGRLTGQVEVDFAGSDREAILHSVLGSGKVRVLEGKLEKLNLGKQLATASQLVGLSFDRQDTPIDEMTANFRIADGWLRSDDLLIRSPDLTVRGKGGFGFHDELDWEATAAFTSEASSKMQKRGLLAALAGGLLRDDQGRIVLPFNVAGVASSPKITLDTQRLLEMRLKGRSGNPLQDLLDGLRRKEKPPDNEKR